MTVASTAAGGACSSFSEEPVSPVGADGGPGVDSSTGAETSTDGSTVPAGRYCAAVTPAPIFCADFDDPTSPLGELTKTIVAAGGTVTAGASTRSTPNAMRSFLPSGGAAVPVEARLSKRIAADLSKVTIELDVSTKLADDDNTARETVIVEARAFDTSDNLTGVVSFINTKDGMRLYVDRKGADADTSLRVVQDLPNTRAWTRVKIAATSTGYAISFDGEPAASEADEVIKGASFDLVLGLRSNDVVGFDRELLIDNVVVRAVP